MVSVGYITNDYFDLEMDIKVGKPNLFEKKEINTTLSALTILGAVVILIFSFFISELLFFLILSQILVLYLYSNHYTRLKENTFGGIIADAYCAHIVPIASIAIISYEVTGVFHKELLLLTLISFFVGCRDIISHQILDVKNDTKSNINTLATSNIDLAKFLLKIFELIGATIVIIFLSLAYYQTTNIEWGIACLSFSLVSIYYYYKKAYSVDNDVLIRSYIIFTNALLVYILVSASKPYYIFMLLHPYFIDFIHNSITFIWLKLKFVIKIWIGGAILRLFPLYINVLLYNMFKLFNRDLKTKPLYDKDNEPIIANYILKILRKIFA